MVQQIVLSPHAVDVLGEQLNLHVRQYPFEFPRAGGSPEQRDHVVRQVFDELESTGLATAGKPEPEVADALYLLCGSEVSIAAAGLLDVRSGQRLGARVVATGEVGVRAVLSNRGLHLEFLSPDELPSAAAALIPDAPAADGSAVSVAIDQLRNDAQAGEVAELRRAMAEITGQTKYRLGHYVVTGNDRRRRRARMPALAWFDTDSGRYVMSVDPGHGGGRLTCCPADRRLLTDRIHGLLDRVGAR